MADGDVVYAMTHDPLTWDNVFGSDPDFQKAQNDDEFWPPQYAAGYTAALRDAVEAVKLSCSADIELVERTQVIAAIEALGGER